MFRRKGGGAPATEELDTEEPAFKEQSDTRSRKWRSVYNAIIAYKKTEDEDELVEHPEDKAKKKLEGLLADEKTLPEGLYAVGVISGRSLLHMASERGALQCLTLLLDHGANVNQRDKYKDTALHIAAARNQPEAVDELLMSGADIAALNKHHKTPFQWAETFGNFDCASRIRLAGGNPIEEVTLPKEVSPEMAEDLMLTKEQLVAYKEAFNLFDEDKSGELDVEELGLVIRSIGFEVSEKEVRDLCYEADEDGSGALNFQEFIELMARRFGDEMMNHDETYVQRVHEEIVAALKVFDKDLSGTLSHDEFMTAMMKFGEPLNESQAEEITTFIDLSGGNEIDYDELAQVLAQK